MKKSFFKKTFWQHTAKGIAIVSLTSIVLWSCKKESAGNEMEKPAGGAAASVMAAAGDSATIIGTINQFRALLGEPLNTTPGQSGGRREVNWDAVPPAFTNANNFPFDFFNNTDPAAPAGRKRGLVLSNTGATFRVDSTDFSNVDPSYAAQFETFSKKRLFVNMAGNVTGVTFNIPGTATDAAVKGFGVIFSDVDSDNSTYVEFYNGTKSLGVFHVPAHPASGSFSFFGVKFKDAKITSLKITSGNGLLGAGVKDVNDGGSKDLVVMDDFFYDEPAAN